MTAEKARPLSLVRKLAEVMAAVERIPKRGRNEFHKYDYATEADIAATVRAELALRHVMLMPSIVGESRHQVGEKGSVLTVLEMEMEFLDGETGESIKKSWRGYGSDKEDKGGYKAMTGAEKFFLMKTFLMPTGNDPERDEKPAGRRTLVVPGVKVKREPRVARPALPPDSPAVYVEKVVPKQAGARRWHEVIFSDGQTMIARHDKLANLCAALVQADQAVVSETHKNAKGHDELDMVRRWPERNLDEENALLDAVVAG